MREIRDEHTQLCERKAAIKVFRGFVLNSSSMNTPPKCLFCLFISLVPICELQAEAARVQSAVIAEVEIAAQQQASKTFL